MTFPRALCSDVTQSADLLPDCTGACGPRLVGAQARGPPLAGCCALGCVDKATSAKVYSKQEESTGTVGEIKKERGEEGGREGRREKMERKSSRGPFCLVNTGLNSFTATLLGVFKA